MTDVELTGSDGRVPTSSRTVAPRDAAGLIVRLGTRVAALGGLGVLVAHAIGVLLLERRIDDLDAEREANALAWLSTTASGVAAVAALLLALLLTSPRRVALLALAVGLAFVSLDEAVQIHERLGYRIGRHVLGASDETANRLQLVAIMPVLATVFLMVCLVARRARRDMRVCLLGGLAALLSAIVFEQAAGTLTNAWEREGTLWPDVLRVGLEEGSEVAGWVLIATGLFAHLARTLTCATQNGRPSSSQLPGSGTQAPGKRPAHQTHRGGGVGG